MQHRAQPLGPLVGDGQARTARRTPCTLALARLMRWAIVASGTRNAAAISRVVRPPTARSVSGMAAAGVSDGWQHMNIRISVSSSPDAGSGGSLDHDGDDVLAPAAGVVAAVLLDQPTGRHPDQPAERVVGLALGGPRGGGGDQRLLHRVLRVGEVAVAADDGAEDLRRELAQQVLGARGRGHTSGSGALITWRTSMRLRIGAPFGPGAADACGRDLDGPVERSRRRSSGSRRAAPSTRGTGRR